MPTAITKMTIFLSLGRRIQQKWTIKSIKTVLIKPFTISHYLNQTRLQMVKIETILCRKPTVTERSGRVDVAGHSIQIDRFQGKGSTGFDLPTTFARDQSASTISIILHLFKFQNHLNTNLATSFI